jgi:hypothetical protein
MSLGCDPLENILFALTRSTRMAEQTIRGVPASEGIALDPAYLPGMNFPS